MEFIDEAVTRIEKANAELETEPLSADDARELLAAYARAEKLASYAKTVLARRLDDAPQLAERRASSSPGPRLRSVIPPDAEPGSRNQVCSRSTGAWSSPQHVIAARRL